MQNLRATIIPPCLYQEGTLLNACLGSNPEGGAIYGVVPGYRITCMGNVHKGPRPPTLSKGAAMGKVVLELVNSCWKPKAEQIPKAPAAGEVDPNGMAAHEPGAKLDFGKAPVMRGVIKYFPRALLAVAALSKNGADKYAWDGWESVPEGIQRYDDALGRHILDEVIEGELDQKWKADGKDVLHATAIAWNALARLELVLREKESTALVRPDDTVAVGGSTTTKENK